jgi:predicted metal-binding integral membrane protein DUF2182
MSTVASQGEEPYRRSPLRSLSPARTALLLLGAVVVAWVLTVERMSGMDEGPGTDLGGLGWYVGVWATITAAMMLPSAAPTALVVARVSRGAPTVLFTAGYLAAWTAYGLTAYGFFRVVTSFDTGWLAWERGGPYVAGGVIAAAGIYELTPPKERFLRRCRSPRDHVEHASTDGRLGVLRIGLAHGLHCLAGDQHAAVPEQGRGRALARGSHRRGARR